LADQNFRVKRGLEVGIGGTVFVATNTGNIGINTTEPTSKLSVDGNILVSGIVTATTFVGNLTGTATSTTNIPNLSGDVSSNNTVTTLATVNSNTGTYGDAGSIPSITVNAKGLVTGVSTVAPNNGQLTLGVSGTGLSGSATFTANQSGSSTFTVTSNATSDNTNNTIVSRNALGGFSAGIVTASFFGNLTGNVTGNLISTGVNTATTLSGTTLTYTTGNLTSLNVSNGNILTGIITNISGTDLNYIGISTITNVRSVTINNTGIATINQLDVNQLSPDGSNYGAALYVPVADGSGGWNWATVASAGAGNLTGIDIREEGSIVGTAGSVTSIDFRGNNIIATGTAGGAIATVRVSDTPTFDSLNVTGGAYVSGNLGIGTTNPTSKLSVVGDGNFTGVITATTFFGALTGTATTASSVTVNSVGLGTHTYGDYVKDITGTANQITVTSGTGEGSSPTLSIPSQFTAPQDLTVTRDLQVNRNLNVNGSITIGGTSATLFTTELKVADPDLVLGFRTDALGNDVSNDNTANHGGIAIASTEGNPLVQLFIAGIETTPATYKKIMWFKSGTFSGLGTDAWLSNYAVGIGSTQFPVGTRLAAGNVQFTQNDLAVVRNINASGVVTATTFSGNASSASSANYATSSGIATYATISGVTTALQNSRTFEIIGDIIASPISFNGTGNVSLAATIQPNSVELGTDTTGNYVTSITNGSYITGGDGGSESAVLTIGVAATSINTSNQVVARDSSGNFSAGTITANLTGTASTASFATTAFNLSDAANITAGTINSSRLSGTYNINISGNADTASYATSSGISTYATTSGVSTNVIGGLASVTQLNVVGVATFNSNIFLGDGDIAYFGDGQDLLIFHNSTDSIIRDNGTGDLFIEGGNRIKLTNPTGIETYAVFNQDGASELWYDNEKKFETTGAGVSVYGTLQTQQLNVTGVSTALSFSGSGINLTGIVTSIVAGSNITISGSTGQVTINASGGGSSSGSNLTGISTLGFFGDDQNITSSVTLPTNTLLYTVHKNINVASGSTITVGSGTTIIMDRFNNLDDVKARTLEVVGTSGTSLLVQGNARIVGVLTVGSSSITLDGDNNQVNVGTGITLHHTNGIQVGSSRIHSTGIESQNLVINGETLSGAGVTYITAGSGISIDQSTGNVTITATGGGGGGGESYWASTAAGIHTLSNVGIGSTNPTQKLDVVGNVKATGSVTATSFSGSGSNLTGIVTSITAGSGISIDQSTGNVTITSTGGGGGISESQAIAYAIALG